MCLLTWLVLVSCLYFSESIVDRIYPQDICERDSGLLNCTCTKEDNMTVYGVTDSSINAVEIHGCGYVSIRPVAFTDLHLQYVVFNNILVLDFKTDAFKMVGSLEHLELSNIVSLKMDKNSIQTVNTSKVILINVTCENVKPYSFNLEGVTHFLVTNSSFGIVERAGFNLLDPHFLFVMNSIVENLLTGAFQVNGTAYQIYFHNTSFVMVQQRSFYFASLTYITFQSCEIQDLHTEAMFGEVISFLFFGNTIVNIESSAFTSLNISYFFGLLGNRFLNSYPGALDCDLEKVINVTIANNTFICNCDSVWLTEPKYILFQNSSFCETSTGNVPLTDLNYKDVKDQCGITQRIDTDMPSPHESFVSNTNKVILDISAVIVSLLFVNIQQFLV